MQRKTRLLTLAAVAVIGVGGFSTRVQAQNAPTTAPTVKAEDKPMHQAHRNLLLARHDLTQGAHDFAGHRAKARQITEEALKEVDLGLSLDPANDKLTENERTEAEKGYNKNADKSKPAESHPVMESALARLKVARTELTSAPHDYNGHRAAALKLVDQAIEEVKTGLASDTK